MTSLYETALNGLSLGTKASDLDQMILDHRAAGDKLAEAILLSIGMALENLASAERQAAGAAKGLADATTRFQQNATVSNAEWLTHYAKLVEKFTRQAQIAYTEVGAAWRLWNLRG